MKLAGGGLIWDNLANAQLQNALLSIAGCQLEVVYLAAGGKWQELKIDWKPKQILDVYLIYLR